MTNTQIWAVVVVGEDVDIAAAAAAAAADDDDDDDDCDNGDDAYGDGDENDDDEKWCMFSKTDLPVTEAVLRWQSLCYDILLVLAPCNVPPAAMLILNTATCYKGH